MQQMKGEPHQTSMVSQKIHHEGTSRVAREFLNEIQTIVMWKNLPTVMKIHYPKGERGRHPSAAYEC